MVPDALLLAAGVRARFWGRGIARPMQAVGFAAQHAKRRASVANVAPWQRMQCGMAPRILEPWASLT